MRKPPLILAGSLVALWIAQAALADSAAPSVSPAAAPPAAAQPASAVAPAAAPVAAEAAKPALGAEATDAQAAKPAATVADDPVICRTELETGSRVRKNKICMTKSEWEKHRQAARRYTESIDRSRSTQPGGGS